MPTILQSDKVATSHLGTAASFGLYVPAWLEGTYSACYSFRRLRQAYTGPLIRVRNNTHNATADVAPATGRYSIDAASLCTIVVAGTSGYSIGQVMTLATFAGAATVTGTRWYDQSGNARFLGNANTTHEPVLLTAGVLELVNGLPCWVCNGTSSRMDTTAATTGQPAWVDAQPWSIVAAVRVAASGNYKGIWDRKTSGVASSAGYLYVNPDNTVNDNRQIFAGTALNDAYAGPNDGGLHRVYAARYDGASSKLYVDGVETASGNAGTNIPEDLRIGHTYWGQFFSNKYQELLVLPSGTEDMAALSTKVMAYHGLA
jgi:hypothetical protein